MLEPPTPHSPYELLIYILHTLHHVSVPAHIRARPHEAPPGFAAAAARAAACAVPHAHPSAGGISNIPSTVPGYTSPYV